MQKNYWKLIYEHLAVNFSIRTKVHQTFIRHRAVIASVNMPISVGILRPICCAIPVQIMKIRYATFCNKIGYHSNIP